MKALVGLAGVVAAAAVALSLSGAGVEATVASTCQAAAASDKRVNLELCVSQLGQHCESPDADAWELAKVACLVGVDNAGLAADYTNALSQEGKGAVNAAAVGECGKLYSSIGFAFADAQDEINRGSYAAGKEILAEAESLTQQCNAAFVKAAATPPPQPLAQRTADSIQIAIIATAITNLIK